VRLRVEGRDLTGRALLTPSAISVPPGAIPPGPARVRLSLVDRAGNATTWRWRVVAPGR
jgi:hypothetical protein